MKLPRITFGIIVLNGHPFTLYNLRALYPFAYQIIVVEGASPNAAHMATDDGHSIDDTLQILRWFKTNEDRENKLTIVTAEDESHPNGFWPGEKDEQSRAYAKRALGDWLWQVDIDEFYKEEDMYRVIDILASDPTITAISFPEIPFWGSFDVRCDGVLLRMEYSQFHRLFKWAPGYQMVTHRPPTVVNEQGIDLRLLHWRTAESMKRSGVYLYHYSQVFPKQVSSKMTYYTNLIENNRKSSKGWIRDTNSWYRETYEKLRNPYRVHTVNSWPSWLERFSGKHPLAIDQLKTDILNGQIEVTTRCMRDVDQLLLSKRYQAGITLLKFWGNNVAQADILTRHLFCGKIGFCEFIKRLLAIYTGRQRIF